MSTFFVEFWNDSHVVLGPGGAYEARTIWRLSAEENFNGFDMEDQRFAMGTFTPRQLDEACWPGSEAQNADIGGGSR